MKKTYISAFAAASLLLAVCESLDYTPGDQMSGQTFWQT